MSTKRTITAEDLLPYAEYAKRRAESRTRIAGIKRDRRVEVGPFATFYFESWDTVWHQIQEMLHIEKGGAAQIPDELEAYVPLIPQGDDLIATVMFEIDDPIRRTNALTRIGGIENHAFLRIGDAIVRGTPDPVRENTSPDGKASSVQFFFFKLTADQAASFKSGTGMMLLGFDHPNYGHLAVIPENVRRALSGDLA